MLRRDLHLQLAAAQSLRRHQPAAAHAQGSSPGGRLPVVAGAAVARAAAGGGAGGSEGRTMAGGGGGGPAGHEELAVRLEGLEALCADLAASLDATDAASTKFFG